MFAVENLKTWTKIYKGKNCPCDKSQRSNYLSRGVEGSRGDIDKEEPFRLLNMFSTLFWVMVTYGIPMYKK